MVVRIASLVLAATTTGAGKEVTHDRHSSLPLIHPSFRPLCDGSRLKHPSWTLVCENTLHQLLNSTTTFVNPQFDCSCPFNLIQPSCGLVCENTFHQTLFDSTTFHNSHINDLPPIRLNHLPHGLVCKKELHQHCLGSTSSYNLLHVESLHSFNLQVSSCLCFNLEHFVENDHFLYNQNRSSGVEIDLEHSFENTRSLFNHEHLVDNTYLNNQGHDSGVEINLDHIVENIHPLYTQGHHSVQNNQGHCFQKACHSIHTASTFALQQMQCPWLVQGDVSVNWWCLCGHRVQGYCHGSCEPYIHGLSTHGPPSCDEWQKLVTGKPFSLSLLCPPKDRCSQVKCAYLTESDRRGWGSKLLISVSVLSFKIPKCCVSYHVK